LPPSNSPQRAYVASKFAFEIDGDGVMGFLNSAEGGGLKTDIVDYKQGALVDVWRQIGRPKFEDITVKVGMGMSPKFYTWISEFFNRKITRKNGAIVMADFNYKSRARRAFMDALISEVQIPTLDGSSKDAAFMTVKLVPEDMTYETIEDGARIESPSGLRQPNKMWHAANFSFTVDGYEDSFKRVTKIDGFSIKQQILEYPSGHRRTPIRVPGRLEYPNLTVYIPAVDSTKIVEQATKRVLTYDAPPQGGMTGVIELRGPDKEVLCTISLSGVDIVSAEPQKGEASAETISMVKVMIQCEAMRFEYKADATA
jgi:phage tail-like protein